MKMKFWTLAALLLVVILIQGCGSMAIINIPQPGEVLGECGGECTIQDWQRGVFLNVTVWAVIAFALMFSFGTP